MNKKLEEALSHPLWASHLPGDAYKMDGKGDWELVYYPMMEDGKTQKPYNEPRALMRMERIFKNGKWGVDFREVPLRYIERIETNAP